MVDKPLKEPETKKFAAPVGRPSEYSQQVADIICERLSEGESLRSICLEETMPNKATVFRWLGVREEFSDQYARAREEQAEALADEIVEIADEEGTMIKRSKHGGNAEDNADEEIEVVFDPTAVARNRLRVEARKWVAAKLKPKKYGEKVTQELTGKDGAPIQTSNVGIDTSKLTDGELTQFVALLEKANKTK